MRKHNRGAGSKNIQSPRELLNRRRFVKGVAAGSVLAFGVGIPMPTHMYAGIGFGSLIYPGYHINYHLI
jgi:hypothetical protein